ncbi:MAG: hypothetical protein AVDCRST_MAG01-01-4655, partial [uncultured Rubrobacteraceae bacterium]
GRRDARPDRPGLFERPRDPEHAADAVVRRGGGDLAGRHPPAGSAPGV